MKYWFILTMIAASSAWGHTYEFDAPEGVSIQEQITSADSFGHLTEVTIYVHGRHEEFLLIPWYMSVTLVGDSPQTSIIESFDPSTRHVIYAWWWKPESDDLKNAPDARALTVKQEERFPWTIALKNLTIRSGGGKPYDRYHAAAIFVSGIADTVIENCLIESRDNGCLVTNLDWTVKIDHSIFISDSREAANVATYNEQLAEIRNSIFIGGRTGFTCSNGFIWVYPPDGGDPYQTEETAVVMEKNCFFGYDEAASVCVLRPDWQLPEDTLLADPRLGSNFRLFPDSPCLGAGTPEIDPDTGEETPTDIGLRPDPEASPPVYGDANGDGEVDALDIQLVINKVLGRPNTPLEYFCDANGDGAVGAVDIQRTIMAVLGKM